VHDFVDTAREDVLRKAIVQWVFIGGPNRRG
jgi:hypothetical protein